MDEPLSPSVEGETLNPKPTQSLVRLALDEPLSPDSGLCHLSG